MKILEEKRWLMVKVFPRVINISPEMERLASPSKGAGRKSLGNDANIREIYYIKIDQLIPFKNQARKKFNDDEIEDLKKSIIEVGVRQPLSVLKVPDSDTFEIVSGERRFQAAKRAGLEKIPCLILSEYEDPSAIALIENLHREDLHPIELGEAIKKALDGFNHGDIKKLSEQIGVQRTKISEALKFQSLPESVKSILLEKNITSRIMLRKISALTSEKEQLNFINTHSELRNRKIGEIIVSGSGQIKIAVNISKITDDQKKALIAEMKEIMTTIS